MNTLNDAGDRASVYETTSDHPERWEIDGSASALEFSLRHLVVSEIRGRFHRWGGTLFLNRQQPSRSDVDVWIDLASIDTGEPDRDAHVRSSEFLDVTQYPRATFKSTSVDLSDERAIVHGLLNLHGVVHDLDLEVSQGRTWTDRNGMLRGSYAIHGSLDRQWFGLHWNQDLDVGGVVVGDRVDVATIVAVIKAPDEPRSP